MSGKRSRHRFTPTSTSRSRRSETSTPVKDTWCRQSLSECQAALGEGSDGLSSKEARHQLRISGTNTFQDSPEQSLLVQFLTRFKNPLVITLVVASTILLLTQEIAGFAIINIIVVFSVTLDFIQEYRAERAAQRLREMEAVNATVMRALLP